MNIDDLTGRELDARVADRLFGREVEKRVHLLTGQKDFLYVVRPEAPIREWVRVPYYSNSLSASLTVEAELLRVGWARVDHQAGSRSSLAPVRVVLSHRDGRTVEASGPFETALCRAALKAVAK